MKIIIKSLLILFYLSSCFNFKVNAQGYGNILFLEDFGSSPIDGFIGPPLADGITTYTYDSVFAVFDGNYIITNHCPNTLTWFNTYDHTEDPPGEFGKMMIVNASFDPDTFYQFTVDGLCEDQNFQFSVWLLNLNSHAPIKPDVLLEVIDPATGIVFNSISTGPLPDAAQPTWLNYTFEFQLPPGQTSAKIKMSNNAEGGSGNDFAIDDISFAPYLPVCNIIASIPELFTTGICENDDILLTADIANALEDPIFIWQISNNNGSTWTDLTGPQGDTYLLQNAANYNNHQIRFVTANINNINNESCIVYSEVETIHLFEVDEPVVDSPVYYCLNDSAVPLQAEGSNIQWFDDINSTTPLESAPTPDTSISGLQTYYVNQSENGCISSKAEVQVIVNVSEMPIVSSPIIYCLNEPSTSLIASGQNLKWYDSASSTIPLAATPIPDTTVPVSINYFVTQTVNGCESEKAEIQVQVFENSPPQVNSPVQYCLNESVGPLTADGQNLVWYSTQNSATPMSNAPTPNTSVAGTQSYWVSQTFGNCESDRVEIQVNVIETPGPQVQPPVSYCLNEIATPLVATGTNIKWYNNINSSTPLSATPTPDTSVGGIQTYYATQTENGCESEKVGIQVNIIETLPPTFNSPIYYCLNEVPTALSATGQNIQWYEDENSSTPLAAAPIPDTNVPGIQNFWVTQTANGCESIKAKIQVQVFETLPPQINSPIRYCLNDNAVSLTATGENLLWYNSQNSLNPLSNAPTPDTSTVGIQSYWVSQTQNNCESDRVEIQVEILPIPYSEVEEYNLCVGNSIQIFPGTGNFDSYYWNVNPPVYNEPLTVTETGNYELILSLNNGCEQSEIVTVNPQYPPVIYSIINGNGEFQVQTQATGTVEYSLDLINWQESNVFTNITNGIYQIYARFQGDDNCYSEKEYIYLYINNAITPNNDGINDYFKIDTETLNFNCNINIYDRYGKLIYFNKEDQPIIWDGKYEGRNVPTSTYWYNLKCTNDLNTNGYISVRNYKQ